MSKSKDTKKIKEIEIPKMRTKEFKFKIDNDKDDSK